MPRLWCWLGCCLALIVSSFALPVGAAHAQTIPLPAVADTYLRQGGANQNQGQQSVLEVQQGGNNRALVRIDPAAIAAAVGSGSLASATLELYATASDNWGTTGRTVDLHRLTSGWTENGATWNCPDDTNPSNGQPNCPAQWAGGTFEAEASDSALHTNSTSGYVAWNVTGDVRAFLAGAPNHGWLAKLADESANGSVTYVSRQGASDRRPRLVLVVESSAFDQVPPSLAITAPLAAIVINDTTPEIRVTYADGGSGIAIATLAVSVDGVAAACTPGPSSAVCEPAALAEGNHTIQATIRDQAGNPATASRTFALLLGPGLRSATFPATADTHLRQGSANQNFGSAPILRVRQSGKNRALIRFDAAAIAQVVGQGTLQSARLELSVGDSGSWGRDGRTVGAHRLTADWSEAGATWNCANDSDPGNGQPNCSPQWAGGTFQAAATSTALHTNDLAGTVSWDVTADVAALLAGTAHHGWLLKKTEENQSGHAEYASREAGAATAPRLVVFFELPDTGGDTTPPTISITAPAAAAVIYNDTTPEIRVEYSDAGSGVNLATLAVRVDGTQITGCTVAASSATCEAGELAAGSHVVTAEISDVAGHRATAERTFELALDFEAPLLALAAPEEATFYNVPALEVRATYSDTGSGIDSATFRAELDGAPLSCSAGADLATCVVTGPAAGVHAIEVEVRDRAGNLANAVVEVTVVADLEAPVLRFVVPAGGEVYEGELAQIQVSYSDGGSGVSAETLRISLGGTEIAGCVVGYSSAVCPAPALGAGAAALAAEARDRAGNLGTATLALNVLPERTPPDLAIVSPSEPIFSGANLTVEVEYADAGSGIDLASLSVAVGGEPLSCAPAAGSAVCGPIPLAAGSYEIEAEIADRNGNPARATREVELSIALGIAIVSPEQGAVVSTATIDLSGTASALATSVVLGDRTAPVSGGTWALSDVPLREGTNALTVVARSDAGGVGTATVSVVRDTEAPRVAILTPRDGFVTSAAQIVVSGDLVDSVSSTAEQRPLSVRINEDLVPAVARKSFVLTDYLLVPGENRIEVTAEDAAGNVGRSAITVRYVQDAVARIEEISGNFQEASARETLFEPLVVRVVDFLGRPLAGRTVDFAVTRGDGAVLSFPDAARKLSVVTDGEGLAQVRFALGTRAGAGNQEVTASSLGIPGSVLFCASARVKAPKRALPIVGTDFQGAKSGAAGQALPKPLLVQVFDEFGNPVPNVEVIYRSVEGGGSFAGAATLAATTDDEGKTSAIFTLGSAEGINNNVVEATFEGSQEPPARFAISGMIPGPAELTSISGVLLDPEDGPVPNAGVHVGAVETHTDAEGKFHLPGVPVGTVHLGIDGSTVTRPGTWPHLGYELVTVSGRDNSVGKPLRLPQVDDESKKWVGGAEDVVIPIRSLAGASLTVFANSATFPGGAKEGYVSFTQVPAFKVPMVAPMNANFQVAWTIQPPGVRFDPPARVSVPNFGAPGSGGMPAGMTVEIFSFDHDLEEFVSAGTAAISEDGQTMVSNPGMGVSKTGWGGCPSPPPPPAGACGDGNCMVCPIGGGSPVSNCDECSVCTGGNGANRATCRPKLVGEVQISRGIRTTDVVVGVEQSFELTANVTGGDCDSYIYLWKRLDTDQFLGGGKTLPLRFTEPELVPVVVEVKCGNCTSVPPISDGILVTVVRVEIIDARTPSRTATPPSTTASFVAPADEIVILGHVNNKPDLNATLRWKATPLDTRTGAADPPTLDEMPEYRFKADSNQSTAGSRNPNPKLGYKIEARLEINGEMIHKTTIMPGIPEVEQDERDIIRQEYVDYGTNFRPTRDLVSTPANPLFNTGNYTLIAEEVAGNLQTLLDSLSAAVDARLNNDEQRIPPGMAGLPPNAVVVSPGPAIRNVGALGDTDPEGDDTCSTPLRNGFCNGSILAGPNGMAETHANNRNAAFGIDGAITSAYRNPQRNRAVGSVALNSQHTRGRALDINPGRAPVAGKTNAELMCILEEAGDAVAEAFAEIGPNAVVCTHGAADHVHIQNG